MFRNQGNLTQYWKEEGFRYLDHALIICEMFDPYKSESSLMTCLGVMKEKNYRENQNRGNGGKV